MKIVDLHVHSRVSDGSFRPEELAKQAKKSNQVVCKAVVLIDDTKMSCTYFYYVTFLPYFLSAKS